MTELEISFRPDGNSGAFVREGWGEQEVGGRWMIGQRSRLVLPPAPWADGPFRLQALVGPFIVEGMVSRQRVAIEVNGTRIGASAMRHAGELTCDIPAGLVRPAAETEIVFIHEDARAPGAGGGGGDMRELAFSVWSLTLFGPERPHDAPPAAARGTQERPVFRLRQRGNLANRAIEFLVGLSVRRRVPECLLSGVELDEWGLSTVGDAPAWADHAVVDEHHIDLDAIAARLHDPQTRKIAYRGYGQRLRNLPPLEVCRDALPNFDLDVPSYDARHLVINIRAGEVLSGAFPHYVLVPPNFYRELIERTGLTPVFLGQLEPSIYTDALRRACPGARFEPSQGPLRDFETVRRAANILVAVSTFSWLAAWLSRAQRIILPVTGLFNPRQFPAADLLPLDDARYEFHIFPLNHAVPPDQLAAMHARLEATWKPVTPGQLRDDSLASAPRSDTLRAIPMFEATHDIIGPAEAAAANGSVSELLGRLRALSLLEFAELMWQLPLAPLPNISRLLPRMASQEAQLGWTGKAGVELMLHTVDFCRIVAMHYQMIRGRSLRGTTVLDFGFGYGRIARVLYWFIDPESYWGIDPMPQSVEICREAGMLGRFGLIDYLPDALPQMAAAFDLIFAYSVFTHTSELATTTALRHLREQAGPETVLVITTRPVEHWQLDTSVPAQTRDALMAEHRQTGFAFRPHNFVDSAGRQVFGENSMTIEWLARICPQWRVVGYDRGLDPYQTILFLVPN